MSYDLLEEKWIPVRCKSGARRFIAPWQIAETDDAPVDIDTGRPDFDCAGIQFLIGLLQTAFTPPDEESWRSLHDEPPTAVELREWLAPLRGKFDLLGDGPRFMQDSALPSAHAAAAKIAGAPAAETPSGKKKKAASLETKSIGGLLIDAPGENTLKFNKDHFVKRTPELAVSCAGAAWLLLTLQSSSPSGGAGHRTSMRGGGPLSTWILGDNLWTTVWRNVVDRVTWRNVPGDQSDATSAAALPWLGPVRVSTDEGSQTQPAHIAPLHHYWGMPRRLWLIPGAADGECAIFEGAPGPYISELLTANYGFDYKGAFAHPLTPYRSDDAGSEPPSPIKGNRNALTYNQWPALVLGAASGGARTTTAALNVRRWRQMNLDPQAAIAVAGYDMDNMKPLGWCHAVMPALTASGAAEAGLHHAALALVAAAEYTAKEFAVAVRASLVRKGDQRYDNFSQKDEAARIRDRFWSATAGPFYTTLRALRDAITAGHEVPDDPIQAALRTAWCQTLHAAGLALFDEASQLLGQWEAADIRRIAEARKWLLWHTKPDGDAMLVHVGLKEPDLEGKPKGKRAKGAK